MHEGMPRVVDGDRRVVDGEKAGFTGSHQKKGPGSGEMDLFLDEVLEPRLPLEMDTVLQLWPTNSTHTGRYSNERLEGDQPLHDSPQIEAILGLPFGAAASLSLLGAPAIPAREKLLARRPSGAESTTGALLGWL